MFGTGKFIILRVAAKRSPVATPRPPAGDPLARLKVPAANMELFWLENFFQITRALDSCALNPLVFNREPAWSSTDLRSGQTGVHFL